MRKDSRLVASFRGGGVQEAVDSGASGALAEAGAEVGAGLRRCQRRRTSTSPSSVLRTQPESRSRWPRGGQTSGSRHPVRDLAQENEGPWRVTIASVADGAAGRNRRTALAPRYTGLNHGVCSRQLRFVYLQPGAVPGELGLRLRVRRNDEVTVEEWRR